jgi:hypothetical protein
MANACFILIVIAAGQQEQQHGQHVCNVVLALRTTLQHP